MTALLPAVVLAPLAAALLIAALGRRLPGRGGGLAVLGPLVSAVVLVFLFGSGAAAGVTWFSIGRLDLTLGLRLDGLSWWVAAVVAWVSTLIHLYAVRYMEGEEGRTRFFAWMAFFAGAMLTVVLSSSLLLLFAAWEGIGLASFALIGQRSREAQARRSAAEAFLVTRLGDTGMLLAWLLVLVLTGTTEIGPALDRLRGGETSGEVRLLLALLFFAAAVGKSAQLPLTAWLPDAMVGPTPVSALLHSATMVAAGVYLLLRLFPLFEAAPPALDVVLGVGTSTALVAAVVATAQDDLKRILAWSTVAQLGEMMLALGLGGAVGAAFHLTTHAVYKPALFLAAGAVEHAVGARELPRLGGLTRHMPWTAAAFVAAALALAGIPPLSGYWSDEAILRDAVGRHAGWGALVLGLIALAGVYIGRAAAAVFGPWPGAARAGGRRIGAPMLVPMLLFALAAVALGWSIREPVEQVLPFGRDGAEVGRLWRGGAIAAGLGGLAFGAWRVYARGPVAALGSWPRPIASAVHATTTVAARLAAAASVAAEAIERALEVEGRRLTRFAAAMSVAVDRVERELDAGARSVADATTAGARAVEAAEDGGFRLAGDRLARLLGRAGGRLRWLETGRVYLYTAGIVALVLVAGLLTIAVWLAAGTAG